MAEAGGNGIGKTHADVNHHIGVLNQLLHLRIAGRTGVGAGKAGMGFIKDAFSEQQRRMRHIDLIHPLFQHPFGAEAFSEKIGQQRNPSRRQQHFPRCSDKRLQRRL
ncbi:hypothetical protein D3C79_946900 [compost metagenome]